MASINSAAICCRLLLIVGFRGVSLRVGSRPSSKARSRVQWKLSRISGRLALLTRQLSSHEDGVISSYETRELAWSVPRANRLWIHDLALLPFAMLPSFREKADGFQKQMCSEPSDRIAPGEGVMIRSAGFLPAWRLCFVDVKLTTHETSFFFLSSSRPKRDCHAIRGTAQGCNKDPMRSEKRFIRLL